MTVHLLQKTQWPRGATISAPEALYFRAEPRASWLFDPAVSLKASLHGDSEYLLAFNTFFGALSLTTWCGAAAIDSVIVSLRFSGTLTLKIYEENGYEGPALLWEQRVSGDGNEFRVLLNGLLGHRGSLYPVFSLKRGDDLEFFELAYYTTKPPVHQPRLAIVMPTYRRELYAHRNIELIRSQVLASENQRCKLFVIDNGQTLPAHFGNGVEVIKNPNFGGSGGFARGMLELQKEANTYTHVLFCDDDVLIEPQAIKRLLNLLGYVSGDFIISGGMMKMGAKTRLHEKSANVLGMHFSSNKSNVDLTDPAVIARYDESSFATFCGWWFVCYPLATNAEQLLPSPFFVGWDDVEMGLRCNRMKMRTLSLLGVAVWHEEFEKKDINWRWFYHTRNGLITALLYDGSRRALRDTWIEIMTALLTYRYEQAQFRIEGLEAVAQGSKALYIQRADELHQQLVQRQKNAFMDVSKDIILDRYKRPLKRSLIRKLFARATMNGHLLPNWCFKSAREPSHPGWVVENIHATTLVRIFRCPRVVYYEPTSGRGMICTIDHTRYFHLLGRFCVIWLRLFFSWGNLRTHWRTEHPKLISSAFWREYLDLPRP